MKAASADDYRELARRRLPPFLFEYIDGGSYAEVTLRRNIADLEAVALRQRVLRDVSAVDLTTELFGQGFALPFGLGPVGIAGLNARRGEAQAVRAADLAGAPFCLSTVSACSIEEVAAAAKRPFWFQLYMVRDRGFMEELIGRAQAAGCSALVFTVDLPLPGARYRDQRSGLSGAPGLKGELRRIGQALTHPAWAWDVAVKGKPMTFGNMAGVLKGRSGMSDYLAWIASNFDPSVTWADIEWVRARWTGPILIKGILDPDDADLAVAHGADGIVVSNHGGRQLDGVASSARALPPIVDRVGDRLTVLADGGVRSGLDVARMLALGAKGVLLGRAWVFALAGGGQAGVEHVLALMAAELRVAMSLTGCTTIAQLDRSALDEAGRAIGSAGD